MDNLLHAATKPMQANPPDNLATTERLRKVLVCHPHIELAILFGSLAADKARPDSDLDIAVASTIPLDARKKIALISDLAEALGRSVDLVDLAHVGEPLLGQILRHGRRILGGDERYARLLSKHVFDMADFMPYRRRILAERRNAWIKM